MNSQEFRDFGKATIDYIADYVENIRQRKVLPNVEKGYLQELIPCTVPKEGEHWTKILPDVENVIMPGMTHWQSPQFNAYYPTASSFPSIIGEMLSSAFGIMGFNWNANPACTELEVIMLDWLGRMLGLPEEFLHSSEGPGGGVIQGSASEATLIALLIAKERVVTKIKKQHPELDEATIKGRLVSYSSDEANSSVEKAGLLSSMKMRLLPSDNKGRLRGSVLSQAIEKDKSSGYFPCCVIATLGTTGTCSFDPLDEIGPICRNENVWLHIDAAYAGSAAICPEFRSMLDGVEYADSVDINPHKWLLVNFDCSTMWVKDRRPLTSAFDVSRVYLDGKSQEENKLAPDFRHWQLALGRRFRSLKLWITFRIYGESGLQEHIRKQCSLAKHFESLVKSDDRFEIVVPATFGFVGFRIKGEDDLTKNLLDSLTSSKSIYLVSTRTRGKLIIRYVICSRLTEVSDVELAWREISCHMDTIVSKLKDGI